MDLVSPEELESVGRCVRSTHTELEARAREFDGEWAGGDFVWSVHRAALRAVGGPGRPWAARVIQDACRTWLAARTPGFSREDGAEAVTTGGELTKL